MTPFQVLYRRPPPTILRYQMGASAMNEVNKTLKTRDMVLQQLKTNLNAAMNRMKQTADAKRREVDYQVGDIVFLKLQPYCQQTAYRRAHQKLASRYFGPYMIEERVGKVAYKLKLPDNARIHPVFHVSMLKKHVGICSAISEELPQLRVPKAILDTRWVRKGASFVEESLVKWKNLAKEDATWENALELRNRFMNLNLEDKVPQKEGGNDELRRSTRTPKRNPRYQEA